MSLLLRVFGFVVGFAIWGVAIWLFLRALSWLVRQPWIYTATIRELAAKPVPEGALLFIGSSTIRFWDTLARDFAPWPVVNRGFGGAVVSQVVAFERELLPASAKLRAIVFYCGANDIAWGVRVADVLAGVERFVELAKERLPGTPIYVVSVGKTPKRRLSWRRVDELNRRLEPLATRLGARWVDLVSPTLGPHGKPRRSLYLFDGIHPSAEGYSVWTSVLRARFEADFGPPPPPS